MTRITPEQRKLVIERSKEGISQRDIAKLLKISRCGIQNILKKYEIFGNIEDRPKIGRPQTYNDREKRAIIRRSASNPFLTARQILQTYKKGSITTMKRLLHKNGLCGRIAARRPFLNKVQIKKRFMWAVNYGSWTQSQWNNVIFSDECSIQLRPTTRVYVRRSSFNKYDRPYILKTVKHGGQSIMVWGAINANGDRILTRFLKNADSLEYQRVLSEGLLPFYDHEKIFQHDGAPCHRSKSTELFLGTRGISYITDWPPQSPDMNIIENMWAELKRNVRQHLPKTINELWTSCINEWMKIPNDYITTLYCSIPKRLLCLRRNQGRNTPY